MRIVETHETAQVIYGVRRVEAYAPGERVRIVRARWRGEQAGPEATVIAWLWHTGAKLPNGTEEDVYLVEHDGSVQEGLQEPDGKRSRIGTGWLVPL